MLIFGSSADVFFKDFLYLIVVSGCEVLEILYLSGGGLSGL